MMEEIRIPEGALQILRVLRNAGYEAYIVGGCVRDMHLGVEPHDWDITTSARPDEVKALFGRTIDTGLKHGTVTVMCDREPFEITTYRVDGIYEDGRHPKEVTFTASLAEDLKRRDFTINAMAYSEETGVVDLFGGLQDLSDGVVRAVGNPRERFGEDALRIMRAFRFAAKLGFRVEENTRAAAMQLAGSLERISWERIRDELEKILTSPQPQMMRELWRAGITAVILPEFDRCMETPQNNPHHCFDVGEHTLKCLQEVRADKVLRLTMLLHDIGKPPCRSTDEKGIDHFYGHPEIGEKMTLQILRRLKYDNATIRQTTGLVLCHDQGFRLTPAGVRKAIVRVGEDLFPLLLEVKQADLNAQSDYKREQKQEMLDKARELYDEIIARGDCLSLRTMAVSGDDLISAGLEPGRELGAVLERMFADVLATPEHNDREYLLGKYAPAK